MNTSAPHPNPHIAAWRDALRTGERLLGVRARLLGLPGWQVSVSVDGEPLGDIAGGLADVETGRPMTPTTPLRVASQSKSFTATAVLQLAEQGRLRLHETVAEHIPELAGTALADATLFELLSHTSGASRDGADAVYFQLRRPFPDREELIETARSAKTLERHERLKYSNVGFALLGLVVEAASGRTFAEYLEEGILRPLGLEHTSAAMTGREDELATGYTGFGADLGDPLRRVPVDHVESRALASAGGVCSTARDLCRFFSAHLPEAGERPRERVCGLLSEDSKRLSRRPVNTVRGRGYGLGLMTEEIEGRATIGHSGGYPGFISRTWAVPETGVVLSVCTNAADGPANEFGRTLFALAELALAPADPSVRGLDASQLSRFEGEFADLWGRLHVARLGRNLYLLPAGQPVDSSAAPCAVRDSATLVDQDPTGFRGPGEPVRFEFDDDGRPRGLRTSEGMDLVRAEDFTLPADRIRRQF
ncbi:serine hydrolase domain-containing protein [Arthrobacter sp. UM1]|uniref:serine hydrolase domain-containing protein n=1 Tax=Arthrobacter sp. UM1 TaxID=2766776 RepID=UPI001CF6A4B5|nr:serine hydrolase domain-containing protein [Arthrobacter sp. UM1]MCB4208404.1 beta-lactamase family protein [Arthrobacter sp. UM1]